MNMKENNFSSNSANTRRATSANYIKLLQGQLKLNRFASLLLILVYFLGGVSLFKKEAIAAEIQSSPGEQTALQSSDLLANRNLMSRFRIRQPSQEQYFINRIVDLTNKERAKYGLRPVRINLLLNQVALGHSEDMAMQDFFDHIGLDGSEPWDRMRAAGYQYSVAAENIAAGFMSPEAVVQAWMDSPGHRDNILAPDVEEIGVGYYYLPGDRGAVNYKHYWTQVFGTPPMYSFGQ